MSFATTSISLSLLRLSNQQKKNHPTSSPWNDAQPRLREPEARPGAHHPHVGCQSDLGASTESDAVDCTNGRERQRLYQTHGRPQLFDEPSGFEPGHGGALLEVGARAEDAWHRGAEDEGARGGGALSREGLEAPSELGEELPSDGVSRGGAAEREGEDPLDPVRG